MTSWDFEEVTAEDLQHDKFEAMYGPCERKHQWKLGKRIVFATSQGITSGVILWVASPQEADESTHTPALPLRYIVQVEGNRFTSDVAEAEIIRVDRRLFHDER